MHNLLPLLQRFADGGFDFVEISLFGRRCPVIFLDDLITAKEAVGREKDLLAVKELRAIAAKRTRQIGDPNPRPSA